MFIVDEFWFNFSGTTIRVEFCWRLGYMDTQGRRFYRCILVDFVK